MPDSIENARPRAGRGFQRVATSLILILIVALCLRLGFAWDQQRQISKDVLRIVPFQYETGNIAYSLATGKGFSSPFHVDTGPTAWTTPVYPLIVAAAFKMFGVYTFGAFEFTVLLNILFSILTCIPIYFAGTRIAGAGVGGGAAWLWAIFPNAIIIPFEWIWDTSLSALLAAIILLATIQVAESQRVRNWCLYGLLWGFALMTNPALGSLLPPLLGWMAWRVHGKGLRWAGKFALAACVAILCCVPWTVRNYEVFHRLVPLRSTLGLQLWLGNNPYYIHSWPAWLHPIDNQAERDKYVQMGEVPYMREKFSESLHYIRAFPRREIELTSQRFVATWLGTAHPIRDFLDTRSPWVRSVTLSNLLVSLSVLGGIWVLIRRRSSFAFPVIAFPVLFPCIYYVTVPLLRYRHPIDPILMLLAATAVDGIRTSLGRRPETKWPDRTQPA